jgi:hypothetical protein
LWYVHKPGNDSGVLKGNDVPLNLLFTFGFKSKTKLFLMENYFYDPEINSGWQKSIQDDNI